jgi:hypothetical protein
MKASLIRLIMGILALAAIAPASLDAQTSAPPAQAAPLYTAAQLDQLLAPVALHPDQLLGQILMASTYPLEVVEAARWVEDPNNARLKGDQLAAALQDKDWDPSVKSLAPFPQILRMMDDRLDWMQKLGDAFLSQQNEVMDSVQRLRRQAEEAGTLQSSPQQTVTTQDQTITVEPANLALSRLSALLFPAVRLRLRATGLARLLVGSGDRHRLRRSVLEVAPF